MNSDIKPKDDSHYFYLKESQGFYIPYDRQNYYIQIRFASEILNQLQHNQTKKTLTA